jgi:hypothetical protein
MTTTSYSSATTGLLLVGELRSPENRGPADEERSPVINGNAAN